MITKRSINTFKFRNLEKNRIISRQSGVIEKYVEDLRDIETVEAKSVLVFKLINIFVDYDSNFSKTDNLNYLFSVLLNDINKSNLVQSVFPVVRGCFMYFGNDILSYFNSISDLILINLLKKKNLYDSGTNDDEKINLLSNIIISVCFSISYCFYLQGNVDSSDLSSKIFQPLNANMYSILVKQFSDNINIANGALTNATQIYQNCLIYFVTENGDFFSKLDKNLDKLLTRLINLDKDLQTNKLKIISNMTSSKGDDFLTYWSISDFSLAVEYSENHFENKENFGEMIQIKLDEKNNFILIDDGKNLDTSKPIQLNHSRRYIFYQERDNNIFNNTGRRIPIYGNFSLSLQENGNQLDSKYIDYDNLLSDDNNERKTIFDVPFEMIGNKIFLVNLNNRQDVQVKFEIV